MSDNTPDKIRQYSYDEVAEMLRNSLEQNAALQAQLDAKDKEIAAKDANIKELYAWLNGEREGFDKCLSETSGYIRQIAERDATIDRKAKHNEATIECLQRYASMAGIISRPARQCLQSLKEPNE